MKKILFPTDYSSTAKKAFIHALLLAERFDAEIIVFHAYELPAITGSPNLPSTAQEAYDGMKAEALRKFEIHLPQLRSLAAQQGFGSIRVSNSIDEGSPMPSIVKKARWEETDYIVMGTKGSTGLREVFLGSIAGEVLEHAPCPVLVIPEDSHLNPSIRKIAVTTSFEEMEKKALHRVLAFSQKFGAEVICVNVDLAHTEFHNQKMTNLQREFEAFPSLRFQTIQGNSLEKALLSFLEKEDIDILAMMTHQRNFLEELFNYSRTKKMVYHSKTPILAIPVGILS